MRDLRSRFSIATPRFAAMGFASVLLTIATMLSTMVNTSRQVNLGAVVVVLCFGASYATLFALSLNLSSERWQRFQLKSVAWSRRLRIAATLFMVVLTTLTFLLFMGFLHSLLFEPVALSYWNDVISFTAANAQAVLHGRNPYTDDANFLPTLIHYSSAPPTPIQGPIFGYGYNYPLQPHVFAIDRAYLRNPTAYAAAFDPATLHSYPALSFLLVIPLILLGQNILWLHMLAYFGIAIWLTRLAPAGQRGWVAFAAASTLTIPLNSLMIDTEVVCLVFLLVAWHYRERRWVSAIALGLGCAFKQYCWVFAPFLLLDTLLREGWREALKRGVIAGVVFLVPNLPFILMNSHAWLTSVFLPLNSSLFPQGMGLVELSLGRILPGWPPLFYAVAELLAYAGALWLFVRFRNELSESVLLLALLPLAFAFRSPANYFAVLPWLALYAMLMVSRKRAASAAQVGAQPEAHAWIAPSAQAL